MYTVVSDTSQLKYLGEIVTYIDNHRSIAEIYLRA